MRPSRATPGLSNLRRIQVDLPEVRALTRSPNCRAAIAARSAREIGSRTIRTAGASIGGADSPMISPPRIRRPRAAGSRPPGGRGPGKGGRPSARHRRSPACAG